jgi:hypothetical protein
MCTRFWSAILKGANQVGDLGVYGTTVLKWILGKGGVMVRTVLNWLKLEYGGWLLRTDD